MRRAWLIALIAAAALPLAACREEPEPVANMVSAAESTVDPLPEPEAFDNLTDFANVATDDIPALAQAHEQFEGDFTPEELRPLFNAVLIRHHIFPSQESFEDLATKLVAMRKATEVNGIASFSEPRVLRCMVGRRPWPKGTLLQTTADGCIIRLQEPSEFVKIPTDEIKALARAADTFAPPADPDAVRRALDRVLIRHGRRLSERSYANLSRKLTRLRKSAEASGRTDVSEMGLLACLRMADVGPVDTSLADAEDACMLPARPGAAFAAALAPRARVP